MDLEVKDQYGIAYKNATADTPAAADHITVYDKQLQVRYGVTDVQGGGSVSVDSNNNVQITGTVSSFTLTAFAGGKSSTTFVINTTP
ncbi:hypothetical protein D3C73_964700 [compost metagenome]